MNEQQRSWLSLVTFCAVTVLIVALGSAVLFTGASVALAFARPAHSEESNLNLGPSADQTVIVPPVAVQPVVMQPVSMQTVNDEGGASSRTFSGMITDSRCGARHRMTSGKSSMECVRSCVRNGAKYVLVDGEKIYALRGDPAQFEKMAGERVNIVGMLEGDTIKVQTVDAG